jgi:hypothetical protein
MSSSDPVREHLGTSSIYDDPELKPADFTDTNVVFQNVGDRVRGRVIRMDKIPTRYGKVAKYWLFDMDRNIERTMLAGAQDLWSQLHELRPEVDDILTIELIAIEGRRYVFNVDVAQEMF